MVTILLNCRPARPIEQDGYGLSIHMLELGQFGASMLGVPVLNFCGKSVSQEARHEIALTILISCCAMKTSNAKLRAFLGFAGALVMALGVITLLQGKLHYQNYWHAPVFAPFSVFVGAFLLFVAIKGGRF
jgi:hypothetical protein